MSDSYEPYGEEWEREMMQFRKKDLIERLRVISKDRTPAISTSAKLCDVGGRGKLTDEDVLKNLEKIKSRLEFFPDDDVVYSEMENLLNDLIANFT